MILLMLGVAVFALILGVTNLVTGPVGLLLAVFVACWLALFGARSLLTRRRMHHAHHVHHGSR